MKQIQGRFLLQSNKDFPADCEMLDYMQTNAHVVSIIGNLAGDKAILLGCALTGGGTQRNEGYVFLRTKEHPEGEVLYWEGGSISGGMYLKQAAIPVQAQGYEYPQAYVERSLAPGVGEENYKWEDFHEAQSLPELEAQIVALQTALAKIQRTPLGMVEIWAGSRIPDGYALLRRAAAQAVGVPRTLQGHRQHLQQCLRLQRPEALDHERLFPPARPARPLRGGLQRQRCRLRQLRQGGRREETHAHRR